MKRGSLIALTLLVLTFPGAAFAQKTPTTTGTSSITEPTPIDTSTLLGRRTSIEVDLRALYIRLSDLTTRTDSAIKRLNQNSVDTKASAKSLATATEKLATAKTAIDAFAAVELTPETTVASAPLKENLLKAENSLRDARNAIVESLLKLRTSITPSTSTE